MTCAFKAAWYGAKRHGMVSQPPAIQLQTSLLQAAPLERDGRAAAVTYVAAVACVVVGLY